MKTSRVTIIAAAAAVVCMSAIAYAQVVVEGDPLDTHRVEVRRDQSPMDIREDGGWRPIAEVEPRNLPQRLTRVQGEIVGVRTIGIRRTGEEHEVMQILTQKGNRIFIDLGPVNPRLDELNLAKGQNVIVRGKIGRVRGNLVMLADNVERGGQVVGLRMPANVTVSGRIVGARDVRVRNTGNMHRIVMLDTRRGRLPVDIGARDNIKSVELHQGQYVVAQGRIVHIDNRPFLMADRLDTETQTVQIMQPERPFRHAMRLPERHAYRMPEWPVRRQF